MSKTQINLKYEDTLQCLFFSTKNYSNIEWQDLCDSINETITSLSYEYIWHRDEFKVVLPVNSDEGNDILKHLVSVTCFGDNIEDEWFIVYILLEITKKHNDLIIQIEDNDGHFLLIEAADYLPSWANPDSFENRVFIYDQYVHLIPPSLVPVDSTLKINEALSLVEKKSEQTKASLEIQQAILNKIGNYPEKIKENCHKAIIKLPLDIAAVLTLKPSLIAPLVSAYCSLDSLDAKFCKDIDSNDYYDVEVKFTKFLYAMLLHTRFPNGFRFKSIANDNKIILGLKLICGYRSIMAKSSSDIFSIPEFNTFINSLVRNGYFKDNLEGSIEHTRLLANAKSYFSKMECPVSTYVSKIINDLKLSEKFNNTVELLKDKSKNGLLENDDDSWLNIHPDQLNSYLNNHYGKKHQLKNNDPITPHILNSELTDFLKETSDYEGVEKNNEDNLQGDTIEFDSENFVNCLEKMLNIISNNDVFDMSDQSDSDDGDSSSEANVINSDQDKELSSKLKTDNLSCQNDEKAVMNNLILSMKQEGLSGPVSNVFRTIGINKSDLLDSDDDA